MYKYFLATLITLCIAKQTFTQKNDKKLQGKLQTLLAAHKGVAGIYAIDLNTNKEIAINADTIFPTASMVKLPILLGILQKIQDGKYQYHQSMQYKDSLFYDEGDIIGNLKNGANIELSKIILLMLSTSDNTASLWLQGLAGGGLAINDLLLKYGFTHTKVNSRTPGREINRTQYGWGQTTPREMVGLLKLLVDKQFINDTVSQHAVRLLSRNYWDEQAIAAIPANVFVASKNGAVNASRSEVLYVRGGKANYIFCICTKNNEDTSWENSNKAWQLAIEISTILWQAKGGER